MPRLLNDDGKDEVGEGLRKEVSFDRLSRAFADDVTRHDGDVGMSHLSILVKVVFIRGDILFVEVLDDTVAPSDKTVEDASAFNDLCVCLAIIGNRHNGLFVVFVRFSDTT